MAHCEGLIAGESRFAWLLRMTTNNRNPTAKLLHGLHSQGRKRTRVPPLFAKAAKRQSPLTYRCRFVHFSGSEFLKLFIIMTTTASNYKTTVTLQFGNLTITPEVADRLSTLGFDPDTFYKEINAHKGGGGKPAVYCGTYHKYACGPLTGMWIDLTSFGSYSDFMDFCKAIHADEEYPELMFQDYENFPRDFYSESGIGENNFEAILRIQELKDQYGDEAVEDFFEYFTEDDDFEDAYCGQFYSEKDFAEHIVDECYDLEKSMGSLSCYFDYDAFARDLFISDYHMGSNGHVFRVA